MKNRFFKLGLVAVSLTLVGAAQAITFSNFTINGSPAPSGNPVLFGSNGLTFSLPSHFLVGTGSSTLQVGYTVTASGGNVLTGFTVSPVGNVRNGSVNIINQHVNGGTVTSNYLVSSAAPLISLPSQSFVLPGTQNTYNVTATINLAGLTSNAISKVTIYNVSYTEAVPEPGTLLALTMGGAALLARRRRKGAN
jgi:hypothetical protein